MTLQEIHTLYEYNYWAKRRILGVVEQLTPGQYAQDLHSSHGGIQGTLVHIMGAEELWLNRWKGAPTGGLPRPEEFPTFAALSDHWDMVEHSVLGFCHMLKSDSDAARVISYKDTKGNSHAQVLGHLMQHLVNHSTYHRGQVVTMLRQLGVKPVGTDLVNFYREKAVET